MIKIKYMQREVVRLRLRPTAPAWILERAPEIQRIAHKHHGIRVRLFGSQARGDAKRRSDVDFLVAFDDQATLIDHSALSQELADLLKRRVNVISERGARVSFLERILPEAIEL